MRHTFFLSLLLVLLLAACGRDSTPQAPTGLTATPGEGKVVLEWQDTSSNELGFSVYRSEVTENAAESSTQQTETFEKIGSTEVNVARFEDTTVIPGTLYRYGVSADGKNASSRRVTTEGNAPVGVKTVRHAQMHKPSRQMKMRAL